MENNMITIHRALTELKTLDARIERATLGIFVSINKHSNEKMNGMTIKEYEDKVIKADYSKVQDLIKRRNKIKSEIVKSNAITYISVAGENMTVAEAIERKSSIQYDKNLLYSMESQYTACLATMNKNNDKLSESLESYLSIVLGNKENRKKEDIDLHTSKFMTDNTTDLIDPIGIKLEIDKLREKIENFEMEVDAVLSESNAITKITI